MKFKSSEEYQPGDVILFSEQIQQRIAEIAGEIAKDYGDQEVVVIGLLRGAYTLTSDLVTGLHEAGMTNVMVDFMAVKSYVSGTEALTEPQITSEIHLNLEQKVVLIVDDIIDTGKTMQFVQNYTKEKGAKKVVSFTLIDKPSRRKVDVVPDYIGFTIPDIWVQGYGMDTDEKGRGDKNIIKGPYFY